MPVSLGDGHGHQEERNAGTVLVSLVDNALALVDVDVDVIERVHGRERVHWRVHENAALQAMTLAMLQQSRGMTVGPERSAP